MSIRDWPEAERPREKLLQLGPKALTDSELLAIFLRTGIAGISAVDLARQLILDFGSLRALLAASEKEFCAAKGLGQASFVQLQAVLEMSRRHLSEQLAQAPVFSSPQVTRDYLQAHMRDLPHEEFWVLFLSSQHKLLASEALAKGTINSAAVYPRELAKRALHHNAAALILAHNHPSGVAEPSQADRLMTDNLVRTLGLLEVAVLDHFVVGDGDIASFVELGWL